MQFPHIEDTTFPNLQTVNVYQFRNEFDYTRWNEKTKIKLCNVLWNSDYADIVKFDTDSDRDAWFDSLTDTYTLELRTSARIVPDNSVKLPIPYDVMARYNYLFVDMPIATDTDQPLDYETAYGIKRWYFFINNIAYMSPNATQVFVQPDVWTIYQNEIHIKYMLLERGHAPVAYSDTDTYLANPMANNDLLLAPDVNFDNASINRHVDYVPFGNGKKYVCIASTCAPSLLASLGVVTADPNFTPPSGPLSYSDDPARYGYQLIVNGFTLGNGMNYGNAQTPAYMGDSNGERIANNLSVYAISADACYGSGTFFADVMLHCPQFLNTIQGCFVVDNACLTFGTAHTFSWTSYTLYECVGTQQNLLTKALTKADFNYPQEYERFAKLYTSPYSKLEITDNDGSVFEVNIEETSTLSVHAVTSLAFPYVNERVYIDGIGGVGAQSYYWRDLADVSAQLQMPNSDWFKYCFDWKIPTFALFMDGGIAYNLSNFNRSVVQGINNALVAYHNSVRSANTAYENACDTADVAYANTCAAALVARDNSYRSADTGKTNADNTATINEQNARNSADTAKLNADNSADAAKQNAYNTAATAKSNADNSALTVKTNTNNSAATQKTNSDNAAQTNYDVVDATATVQENNQAAANLLRSNVTAANNASASDLVYQSQQKALNANFWADRLISQTTDTTIQKTTQTSYNNNLNTIISGAAAGAQTTSVLGGAVGSAVGTMVMPAVGTLTAGAVGAIGGAVVGAIVGATSAALNSANVDIITNATATDAQNQKDFNLNTTNASNQFSGDMQNIINGTNNDVVRYQNATELGQTQAATAVSRANAAQQKTTTNTNATNDKNTSDTNATNSYNTATANNAASETTAKTNADNTQNAAKTNASNSKNTAYVNADNSKRMQMDNATLTKTTSRSNAYDTYMTATDNAENTRDNIKDNSGYTQEVAILNAKELLENALNGAMAPLLDARNALPQQRGYYAGDAAPDYYRTRGIQIKVKTQSDSAIRQAGDTFARYGYALNQIWDTETTGLKLMNYFTYWKAMEVWIDDKNGGNNYVEDFIQRMFLRGVTVWNDPTEIGRVNVYNN